MKTIIKVYTFGCNDEFALGRDNDEEVDKVNLPEKCVDLVAGDSFTAALAETGTVFAWGTFRVNKSLFLQNVFFL